MLHEQREAETENLADWVNGLLMSCLTLKADWLQMAEVW